MLMNCLNVLAELKKGTGCDEVTVLYTGNATLMVRFFFERESFAFQRQVSLYNWVTYEDEMNDVFAMVEEALEGLKQYGRKPNAQLDSRPNHPPIDSCE
jgi:hypothetical protein